MKDGTFTADRLLALYDRMADAEDVIPRLRRFVLNLAVRGKLVEQDPSDEPAAELLNRIAKEKARLESAGQVRRSTDVAPSSTSPTFSAPSGWVWTQLQRLARARMGKTILSRELVASGLPVFSAGMENRPWGYVEASDVMFRRGTLVISARGGIGFPKIPDFDEFVSTQTTIACECFDPALATYIRISLDALVDWKGITSQTAIPMITVKQIHSLGVPLPPLAEQQRIVAKVDELMALCDRLQAARAGREVVRDRLTAATWARLTAPETDAETFPTHARFALQTLPTLTTRPDQIKTLRQTILNLAVRGKLVAQDPTDEPAAELLKRAVAAKQQIRTERRIGRTEDPEFSTSAGEKRAPRNWVWANLADFALVLGGKRLPAGADFSAEPTDHIYIRVTDMKDGTILSDKLKFISSEVQAQIAKYTIDSEDIYITIAGTIGDVGDVPGAFHGHNLTENAAKIVFREVSKDFLLLVLKSQDIQDQFTKKTKQMAQPKLALKRILGARLPLPPLAEQHRIVTRVDALMALCDQLEASLTTATITRSRLLETLLHDALTKKEAA